MARDYLTVADVLGMHSVLMQRYGGALGVQDPGALEAALFRPQTGYYEATVNIPRPTGQRFHEDLDSDRVVDAAGRKIGCADGLRRRQIITFFFLVT